MVAEPSEASGDCEKHFFLGLRRQAISRRVEQVHPEAWGRGEDKGFPTMHNYKNSGWPGQWRPDDADRRNRLGKWLRAGEEY
jgi:hypothetical protein